MKPIIFARITSMKYYKGVTEDDRPLNGGSYVKENNDAHESHNFMPIEFDDGSTDCIGYVQLVGGGEKLHIENIYGCKSRKKEDFVDDVIVVFVATRDGSMRVVGFYKNAEVYRDWCECIVNEGTPDEYIQCYYFRANKEDCVLIPEHDRYITGDWYVPMSGKHGYDFGFGHANVWFAGSKTDNPKEIEYVEAMISRIENYKGENWIDEGY